MNSQKTNEYLKTQVLTASREQLLLMLYDGAIRFASQGREKMLGKDYEAMHNLLVKAQNIVLELMSGLRPDVDPILCQRLSSLYTFMYMQLVKASVEKRPELIGDVLELLGNLRETWVEAIEKLKKEGEAEAGVVPHEGRVSVET